MGNRQREAPMAERDRKEREEPLPAHPGIHTGGTLAGEEVRGGSVIRGGGHSDDVQETPHSWDSLGDEIETEPEDTGTLAGNTTAAGAVVDKPEGPKPGRKNLDLRT